MFSINRIRQNASRTVIAVYFNQYSKLSKWDLMQIRLVKMAGAYSKPFNISIFWYYINQIMNVFIRAMVRIFSFGERWNVPFNSAVASLNGTFHLSPHENILTIALINIHYLYNMYTAYLLLHVLPFPTKPFLQIHCPYKHTASLWQLSQTLPST